MSRVGPGAHLGPIVDLVARRAADVPDPDPLPHWEAQGAPRSREERGFQEAASALNATLRAYNAEHGTSLTLAELLPATVQRTRGAIRVARPEEIARPDPALQTIRANLAKVVVGQRHLQERLLTALVSGGHVLLKGDPGVGKTLVAKLLGQSIDTQFARIQFTPDLLTSSITGRTEWMESRQRFEFVPGPIFAGVVLADEINRAPPHVQSALFEALGEGQVTDEGVSHRLPDVHLVIATQNEVDYAGTYDLPPAQLDRFAMQVVVEPLDVDEEVELLTRRGSGAPESVEAVTHPEEIAAIRDRALRLHASVDVLRRGAEVVHMLRSPYFGDRVELSPKTRGTLALIDAARAHAYIQGRDALSFDDIAAVAPDVLRHRLRLTREAEEEGQRVDDVVLAAVREVARSGGAVA